MTRNIASELRSLSVGTADPINRAITPEATFELPGGASHTVDLGTNFTGFIGATVECREAARIHFVFDEILSGGDVNWQRMGRSLSMPISFSTASA